MMESIVSLVFGRFTLNEIESVKQLHKSDFFISSDSTIQLTLQILLTAIVIATSQALLYQIFKDFDKNKRSDVCLKRSYQLTNLAVNSVLACYGLYYFIYKLPDLNRTLFHTEKIDGLPDLTDFGIIQIGYQIWAIPAGLFLVNEAPAMLVHHIAVIIVAGISTYVKNGFRYFTPFFYGLIEFSSVPLSIMNIFKNNREWRDKFPKLYLISRLLFSISFLIVRVIMWLPQIYDYLRYLVLVTWTADTFLKTLMFSLKLLSAILLTFLQMYWAILILKTLFSIFLKPKTKRKPE